MRSFNYEQGKTKFTIHYNGDYSGDVQIIDQANPRTGVKIPLVAILDFVAHYLRATLIDKLDNFDGRGIVDWLKRGAR